jgi:hypothetical protein
LGKRKPHRTSLRISEFWLKDQILTILVMNQEDQPLTYDIIDAKHLRGFDKILMSITQELVAL